MQVHSRHFSHTHVIYPLMILVILSSVINAFDIDKLLADYFYTLQNNTWAWKNSWLMEQFFHKGGRAASILLALIIFALIVTSYCLSHWKQHRKPLTYLILAAAGGSLLVSFLKSSLAVSCPWEFQRYGGNLHYNTVFEQLGLRNGEGCFPSGHASAGYAWIALYFFGLCYGSPSRSAWQFTWRWAGLVVPLITGIVFGFAQQLRGAHFISHDVWTLAICWFYSLALYLLMFEKIKQPLGLEQPC
jgi:membrane-associated PAP2 superfamily phosphatase